MSNSKAVSHKVFSLRKDVKVKRLALIWSAAILTLLVIGSQIVTFNQPFYDVMRPETINTDWFTPVFTAMAVAFPVMAGGYLGYHTFNKKTKISDNTYNVLRLTGFTIIASTALVYVITPVIFGTFLPFILGDFTTMTTGAIPAGYAMTFPIMFIVLVIPAPFLGIIMSTVKADWIKVSNDTYLRTRNWFVASAALSFFLLPLTVFGQGAYMLDATGLYTANWQSNMFFASHVGGQVAMFVVYAISMLNKDFMNKLSAYKKYSRIKNQFLVISAAIIFAGGAFWFFDAYVIQNLYTIGVGSLGHKIDPNIVFAELPIPGIVFDPFLTAGEINALLATTMTDTALQIDAYGSEVDIWMGTYSAYYLGMLWGSIFTGVSLMAWPFIDYLFFGGKQIKAEEHKKEVK